MIDGRQYDLVERHIGIHAEDDAKKHAQRIRDAGGMARVVRFGRFDCAVYALGGQSAWHGHARKPKGMNRAQAARMVVSILADAYGGDGWDDPRLPGIVENGWMAFPMFQDTVDAAWAHAQADELIEQSFDPRVLLPEQS